MCLYVYLINDHIVHAHYIFMRFYFFSIFYITCSTIFFLFLHKGMLMYEIHMPLIMLAKLEMQNGKMTKDNAKKEFRRAILNLKMSLEMLKNEPDGSFEKNIQSDGKGEISRLCSFSTHFLLISVKSLVLS